MEKAMTPTHEIDQVILEGAEGVLKKLDGNASTERLRRLVELGLLAEKAFKVNYPEDRPGRFIELNAPEFQRILKLVKS